ncbi:hypothetical protein FSP39_017003 [Pinctada imbricata]|uniref:Protein kinase domain-containing protein n=1 Tax=Pinctada imbricata TaxID=66713 RepID=A0AA89CB21_PINIB|nr:hypothetical protein FSP39_017003 [Pinctada imbricata]
MSTVKIWNASENYRWCCSEILGRGATAVVYRARSLITGDECAVKVFHDRVSHHYASVPIKELELLQQLKHRNIISILQIEREKTTNNHVLAMELCSGGSVYSMLDQPKYAYGFPEEEFLIFLDDLAEGMKYLRIHMIIHRDIKPGNIMRKVDDNGRSVYQLTDFGAARHLQDEETFTSIYGTEEYLDPGMYEKAVLRKPTGQDFGADVDIWSLGVTVYHVCTGQLPFLPWGGRSNSKTMHLMTSKKEFGVISAIQRTEHGEIEYRKTLPKTCLLSLSLKSMITPMLARLMESDITKRMNFDRFYNDVKDIGDMVIVKVFDCCTGINNKLYVNKKDRYAKFQEIIASISEIPAGEQLILFLSKELNELVEATKEIKDWPKKLIGGQFFLYQRERLDQQRLALPEIPPLPQFPDYMTLDRDSYVAHKSAGIASLIERYIKMTLHYQELMQESETNLRDFIMRIVRKINNLIPNMSGILDEHRKRQSTFYDNYGKIVLVLKSIIDKTMNPENLQKCYDSFKSVIQDKNPSEVLKKAENRAEECKVYMDVLMQKMLDQESEAITYCVGCLEEDHCIQKGQHLCTKVTDIWSVFSKHRKQKTLSEEEEFCHKSDRGKLTDYCVQIISLLQGHCLLNTTRMYAVVGKQIALLLKNLQRTKKVEQNIASVNECREKLSARITKVRTFNFVHV